MILVLFLALKYIEVCLFLFCFGLIGVLRTMRVAVASLSRVLRDTSVFSAPFSPPPFSFYVSVSPCSIFHLSPPLSWFIPSSLLVLLTSQLLHLLPLATLPPHYQ